MIESPIYFGGALPLARPEGRNGPDRNLYPQIHHYARGARHFALARARSFAHLFQFGMVRLVFGFTQVFFVSFAMSCSGWSVRCRH
jgi:hypothetical protein